MRCLGREWPANLSGFWRPGLGGSTRVDVPLRIPVWLETVPVLMELLGVKHVALVSHSCGSLYLLNTLYHLRHILSPTKPYVALMGKLTIFSFLIRSFSRFSYLCMYVYINQTTY